MKVVSLPRELQPGDLIVFAQAPIEGGNDAKNWLDVRGLIVSHVAIDENATYKHEIMVLKLDGSIREVLLHDSDRFEVIR